MPFRELEITQLSGEQIEILQMPTQGRLIISGPPGSGKTILALLRLKKIDDELNHHNTRLVMFNRMVRMEAIQAARHLRIQNAGNRPTGYMEWLTDALNEMCGVEVTRAQIADPSFQGKPNWEVIDKMLISKEVKENADRWVVVDEWQDFPQDFYDFLYKYWNNVTVFADENQIIGEDGSTIKSISQRLARPVHMTVTTNFRNTREVAALADYLHTKGVGGSPGVIPASTPRGPMPELFRSDTDEDFAMKFCRKVITDLIGRNPQPDHALLTATPASRKKIAALVRTIWPRTVNDRNDITDDMKEQLSGCEGLIQEYVPEKLKRPKVGAPGIFIMTMNAAKGCEFESVTLHTSGLNERHAGVDQRKLLYVACTRTRGELLIGVVCSKEALPLSTPESLRDVPISILANSSTAETLAVAIGREVFASELFAVGQHVRHRLFGIGVVDSVINGNPTTLEITFKLKGKRLVTAQSVSPAERHEK